MEVYKSTADGDSPYLATAYSNYGPCLSSGQDPEESLEYFEIARDIYVKRGDSNPSVIAPNDMMAGRMLSVSGAQGFAKFKYENVFEILSLANEGDSWIMRSYVTASSIFSVLTHGV